MQIKRFEAKTMTAALKLVKEEFGPDAVILSARSLRRGRGFFGAERVSGVEVTAATDYGYKTDIADDRPAAVSPHPAAQTDEAPGRSGLFQTLNQRLRFLAGRQRLQTPEDVPRAGAPELAELHHHLLAQEIRRELAGELIDRIQRLPGHDPSRGVAGLRPLAGGILQDMGLSQAVAAGSHGGPRVVVLVGPSGVGKTTAAIKLAAVQAMRPEPKAALVTLDDRRIGALEQLQIYARILKVPLALAVTPQDARQALQNFKAMDCLIVDTPGISPGEEERYSELQLVLEPLKPQEVHLLLNASTSERDLLRLIDAWKRFPVNRLAFTHLDEVETVGRLLNLLIGTRLPLSYVSTGPRIPDDWVETPLEGLIDRIWPVPDERHTLRSTLGGTEPVGGGSFSGLVANRNSDLYHRPECKWALKIKHGNLIQFASAAEAEARRFTPCRSCRPDGFSGGEPVSGVDHRLSICR